ncbi:uncharacterized protein LOC142165857 [Nicotiana tabacum]|uniref:Uncharacterized protein LOC142165857 n=1 Tax=Nicotiana tabacum TaxID=4097 RepID=A0AC58S5S3_TOBAC
MRIFQLHREIATISQGMDSVSMYFTKLKELRAMVPSTNSKEYTDHLQLQKLLQLLSRLNDSYAQARRQILMKSVEPTLNQAYALVVEDESQRNTSGTSHTGLNSIAERNDITTLWSLVARGGSMYKNKRNFNIYCEFCKIKGHSKENYYQLIGYPADFKGRRNQYKELLVVIKLLLVINTKGQMMQIMEAPLRLEEIVI